MTILNFCIQRVHLDIHVGEQTMDYAGIAQKEKLTELQLRVRQLLAQVDQINKEQNYQRVRKTRVNFLILHSMHLKLFKEFLQILFRIIEDLLDALNLFVRVFFKENS